MSIGLSDVKNINLYSYKELRVATEDFSPANKIGEGGFGSVYKVTAHFIWLLMLFKGIYLVIPIYHVIYAFNDWFPFPKFL